MLTITDNRRIGRSWLVVLIAFLAVMPCMASGASAAATAQMVVGAAQVIGADGAQRELRSGTAIAWGDTVATRGGAYAYLVFENGSTLFMRPHSRFVVDHLPAARATDQAGSRARPTLLRFLVGGFRVITGALAKHDRAAFGFQTPVATIGIRGTQFEVRVDDDATSSIYVFTGAVDVSNPAVPARTQRVESGQFTVVRRLLAPTPARPFDSQDFDAGSAPLSALERAEDPLLESTETPAEARYLAFADPDLDAQRNPAYMTESRGRSLTVALAGRAMSQSSRSRVNGVVGAESRRAGEGAVGQAVGLWPMRGQQWVGAFGVASTEALRDSEGIPERRDDTTLARWRAGLAWGRVLGHWGLAVSGVDDGSNVDTRGTATARSDNRTRTLTFGALHKPGGDRTLGLSYSHAWRASDAAAGDLDKTLDGDANALELLYRASGDARTGLGARLRIEHSRSAEEVSAPNAALYTETIDVQAIKAGLGYGWLPAPDVVVAADWALGYSRERAQQRHPPGDLREDERDERLSAGLHIGAQVRVHGPLVISLDATPQYLRDHKRFLRAAQREIRTEERYLTAVSAGLGVQRGQWYWGYFAARDPVVADVLTHNLFAVVHW